MEIATVEQAITFDDLITRILARFASGAAAQVATDIQTSLREIAEFVGADYAHVVRTAPDLSSWSLAYEWCSPCAPSQLANHQDVPMGSWGWIEQVLLGGQLLRMNRLEDLPAEAAEVREQFRSVGFRSTLHVPTHGPGGKVSGCVALSTIVREVSWSDRDVQRLRLVAEAIANAIERARVEQELAESEWRYRATFERAPVGIVNMTRDGRLLRANQRFCEMLGCLHEDLIGESYWDLTHPDDLHATAHLFEKLLGDGDPHGSLEKRYQRKDGREVWGHLTLSLLADDDAHPEVIVAVIEDITARRQAEETFDAVPDLVFVADDQRRIVRANQAVAKRLGVTVDEVLGRYCDEIIRDGGVDSASHWRGPPAADRQARHFESHQPQLGGDFLVSCTPLFDARGELTGSVYVARDVTELRRSEGALRHAHDELQQRRALVVAASLDGVWEWESASEQVQYSERFAELLGYETAELPQTLEFFRSLLHPDDSDCHSTAFDQHIRKGIPYDVECRLRTKRGSYRWFRMRGPAQHDANGERTWMAGSIQDIDEQKTAEADLRMALEEVERLTERLRQENLYLQEEIVSSLGFEEIIGESEPLRSALAQIEHVATTGASVLLLGETGTGKELFARAIHHRSPRKHRPLVKVNLAALSSSLIESELFGHVKGAFTGALANKVGRFQLADGGTLFLDEVGELDPELQTKLLRVLQEGEFERIGSSETCRVDVRIVAATNRNLRQAMEMNRFRPDLYYRLAVFPIEVPPLRLRRDDIPLLVWHFVTKKQGRLGKTIDCIPTNVMQTLTEYDWPGNIRELENVIERAMILTTGTILSLPEPLKNASRLPRIDQEPRREEIDRARILSALETCRWKIKGTGNAAERLGLKPSTLRYRMKVLGIQRPEQDKHQADEC